MAFSPSQLYSYFFLLLIPIDEVSLLGVFRGKGERRFHLPSFFFILSGVVAESGGFLFLLGFSKRLYLC